VAPRVLGENEKHLTKLKEGIIEHDGEGVILRKVHSLYKAGKSSELIKLKVYFSFVRSRLLFTCTEQNTIKENAKSVNNREI
jgi:ATP-dependent DNA ligase